MRNLRIIRKGDSDSLNQRGFNNLHTFAKIKRGLFFILLLLFASAIRSQDPYWCNINSAGNPRHGRPHPDCDISNLTEKCVKIKFHYLNNTSGASNSPDDQEFFAILDELNKAYKQMKIKFDFGSECIHRDQYIAEDAYDLLHGVIDNGTGEFLDELDEDFIEEMEYAPDYLNVYFCKEINPIGGFIEFIEGGVTQSICNIAFVNVPTTTAAILNFNSNLAHEVGHALGLAHTFGSFATGQQIPLHHDCLCKATNINYPFEPNDEELNCAIIQDALCDTGLDPYGMDLDPIGIEEDDDLPDGDRWVIYGKQSSELTPAVLDGCDDDETPWNIPARNIMSYYIENPHLRNQFSDCQIDLVHDLLVNKADNLLLQCGNDTYGICEDIIIDEPVIWDDETIYMCRDQKIIIKEGGSLTLDNVILTVGAMPDPPDVSCPDLIPEYVQLWPGIVLDYTFVSSEEDPPALYVLNGSVIEYAETAISVLNTMGTIEMENSTIQNCLKMIDANDYTQVDALLPGPLSHPEGSIGCEIGDDQSILITDSYLYTDESVYSPVATEQIKLNGVSIVLNGTTMTNNDGVKYVGIDGIRGRIKVVNGTVISNYNIGIYKRMDLLNLCAPRGLVVTDSKITGGNVAITNNASIMKLIHNKFDDAVLTDGLGYLSILRNNFSNLDAVLECRNPFRSAIIKENCFHETYVTIDGLNNFTNLLCNSWTENYTGDAVEILPGSTVPKSWGDIGKPSGNINDNNPRPYMRFGSSGTVQILNYAKSGSTDGIFYYSGQIGPYSTIGDPACSYEECPTDPSPNPIWEDDDPESLIDLEEDYDDIDSLITVYSGQLGSLFGTAYTQKLEQIWQLKIELDDVVRRALDAVGERDTLLVDNWLDRMSPRYLALSKYLAMWYNSDFGDLGNELDPIGESDSDILEIAADYMASIVNVDRSIFELEQIHLDSLTVLAESSYGDFTNILRTFLDAEYDIFLTWPDAIAWRDPYLKDENKVTFHHKIFTIAPNPASESIQLLPLTQTEGLFNVNIFNAYGSLLKSSFNLQSLGRVWIGDLLPGYYIVNISNADSGINETHKLIVK